MFWIRNSILLIIFMLFSLFMAINVRVDLQEIPFQLRINRPQAVFTEIPFTVLKIPTSLSFPCPIVPEDSVALYMATSYVALCVANRSTLLPTSESGPIGFGDLSTCSIPFSGESWRSWPPQDVPAHSEWYRNYDGVFAAIMLPKISSILLIRHGEHKNEKPWANNLLYQGLINPTIRAESCYSGIQSDGQFSDCQPSYNAFVSGAILSYTASTCYGLGNLGNISTQDAGPLVWPVNAYVNTSGGKTSYGVRHPGGVSGTYI